MKSEVRAKGPDVGTDSLALMSGAGCRALWVLVSASSELGCGLCGRDQGQATGSLQDPTDCPVPPLTVLPLGLVAALARACALGAVIALGVAEPSVTAAHLLCEAAVNQVAAHARGRGWVYAQRARSKQAGVAQCCQQADRNMWHQDNVTDECAV